MSRLYCFEKPQFWAPNWFWLTHSTNVLIGLRDECCHQFSALSTSSSCPRCFLLSYCTHIWAHCIFFCSTTDTHVSLTGLRFLEWITDAVVWFCLVTLCYTNALWCPFSDEASWIILYKEIDLHDGKYVFLWCIDVLLLDSKLAGKTSIVKTLKSVVRCGCE